jgi:predicted RNase H-like HicB family nuclease
MHNYDVVIDWSREDQVYVAEVPKLPGCFAHGDTEHLALLNANQAIDLWLDTAREFGDPIPEPRGQRLVMA